MKKKFLFILSLLGGTAMATLPQDLINFRNTLGDYKNMIAQGDEPGYVCVIAQEEIGKICEKYPDNMAFLDLSATLSNLLATEEDPQKKDVLEIFNTFLLNLGYIPHNAPVPTSSQNPPPNKPQEDQKTNGKKIHYNIHKDTKEIDAPVDVLSEKPDSSIQEYLNANIELLKKCKNGKEAAGIVKEASPIIGAFLEKRPDDMSLISRWLLIVDNCDPEIKEVLTLLEEMLKFVPKYTLTQSALQCYIEALESDIKKGNQDSAKKLLTEELVEQVESFLRKSEDPATYPVYDKWAEAITKDPPQNDSIVNIFRTILSILSKDACLLDLGEPLTLTNENFSQRFGPAEVFEVPKPKRLDSEILKKIFDDCADVLKRGKKTADQVAKDSKESVMQFFTLYPEACSLRELYEQSNLTEYDLVNFFEEGSKILKRLPKDDRTSTTPRPPSTNLTEEDL